MPLTGGGEIRIMRHVRWRTLLEFEPQMFSCSAVLARMPMRKSAVMKNQTAMQKTKPLRARRLDVCQNLPPQFIPARSRARRKGQYLLGLQMLL